MKKFEPFLKLVQTLFSIEERCRPFKYGNKRSKTQIDHTFTSPVWLESVKLF